MKIIEPNVMQDTVMICTEVEIKGENMMKNLEMRGGTKDDWFIKVPVQSDMEYFIETYTKIAIMGLLAIIFCTICLIFKCSYRINVPDSMHAFRTVGEFLFDVAVSLLAAEIFFILQVVIPEHKKKIALNEMLCEDLKKLVLSPCFKLMTEEKFERLEYYTELQNKLGQSIQKCVSVYSMPDSLFEALWKLKDCGFLNKVLMEDLETYDEDYHKTGKELLDECRTYYDCISKYCEEHQSWVRVTSAEGQKILKQHRGIFKFVKSRKKLI
ncbi:MAG: hypothetical protein V8R43_01400 [Dorea sp.]